MNINAVSRYRTSANNGYKMNFGNVIKPIGIESYTIDLSGEQKPHKKGIFSRIKDGVNDLITNIALLWASIGYNAFKAWAKITEVIENAKNKVCGLFRQ